MMDDTGRCVKLVDNFENKFDYITNDGRIFYFRTNRDAPKYKVVKVKLPDNGDPIEKMPSALAALRYSDVVAMDEGVLNDAQAVAGKFLLLQYLRDVVDELEIVPLAGGKRVKVPLPGKGKDREVERSDRSIADSSLWRMSILVIYCRVSG